VLKGAVMVIM